MDTPLSQINSLMPLIEKIAADKAAEIVAQKLAEAQYSVPKVPDHHHNGVDSIQLGPEALTNFTTLPATTVVVPDPLGAGNQSVNGVVSPAATLRQTINQASVVGLKNIFTVSEAPLPIIYGVGTTTAITMTGSPLAGATSATLTAPWGGATATYSVQFGGSQVRNVNFTAASTAITWTPGLDINTGSTGATVTAGSRFNGGDAPYGTVILFRNDDDNIMQIWVRSEPTTVNAAWFGFNSDAGSIYR